MRLSVVIPTYNRRDTILRTLPTVLDQTFPSDGYEVIVVVDGSTDGTAHALRSIVPSIRLKVLEQDNLGQAAARNTGLRAASGDVVLFLDDDLFCTRSLVAEHAAAHEGGNYFVLGPIKVAPESPDTLATKWLRRVAEDFESRMERKGAGSDADVMVGGNSSVRREMLVEAGGFDEQFFRALEDLELGRRLSEKGVRLKFCPAAVTHQLYSKTAAEVVFMDAPLYGANEVLLCRKHPEFRRVSSFADFQKGPWLKRIARMLSVRLPVPLAPLLGMAEGVARINSRLAVRIFNALWRVSIYRGLVKAVGGWDDFERGCLKVLPVLMYHRVGPVKQGTYPALTVSPVRFRKQMGWLKRKGYSTIHTGDWLAYCLEGKPLPEKPVLLTFDDAYAELVEYAFPVLKEHGFTAAVFVVTGELGGGNSWDTRQGSAGLRCMGADDIRLWSKEGMEFGAHSRTHPDLTALPASALEEEVAGSGRDLERILGEPPLSFAYPGGSYNDHVLREAGRTFRAAFTCEDDGVNDLGTPPLLLRRAMVGPRDSLVEFGLSVRLGFNPVEAAVARVIPFVPYKAGLRRLLHRLGGY